MENTGYFKHKKVTVVGFARSGLACANLLYDLGAEVSVTDNQDNDSTRLNVSRLKAQNIRCEIGKHSAEFIKDRDLIVVSPGVPDTALPIVLAREFKIPIISEIELAWLLCPATVIAVTGSNGKTTVTTLIGKMLEADAKRVFILGNIGNPFAAEVEKMQAGDFVALEVSSFQLEKIRDFKPRISLILNFSCNHLDRHKDMQEYLAAKKRIFMNQDQSDYTVLNYDDPMVRGLADETKAKVICFSQTPDFNPNQAAVLAVGSILGTDKEACLKVLREFRGLEHRLEHVAEINNITFINDSKSTTVDSTIWALKNITRPIVLIAGGRHKGLDYSVILELIHKKVKDIILIGEAKEKIKDSFKGFRAIQEAATLDEAVRCALSRAKAGDCVLFSPMCSSFDMFSNYEERGRVFKKTVLDLTKSSHGP
ncbi:MAG: UDP-N-acetylmuramoyl-L-alanine--D-glutamate ligase [Candidatus Omnitrophota bacterium]